MFDFAKPFAVAAALLSVSAVAEAATFDGTGSLNREGDLTFIEDGDTRLSFLDPIETTGLSADEAVAAYDGFALATFDQVVAMLDAFGIESPERPVDGGTNRFNIDMESADLDGFFDTIGVTNSLNERQLTNARFDNGGSIGRLCISSAMNCSRRNAFFTDNDFRPTAGTGTFLVSASDVAPVPVPAALPLLLAGVGALAVARRRKG